MSYLNPSQINDQNKQLAEEFERYLAIHCIWSEDDFGGHYAWDAEVPAREDWEREVAELNNHLTDRGEAKGAERY